MTGSKELDQVKEELVEGKAKYLRPSECRNRMRRTLTKEFDAIIEGFVEAAKKGSCPHVKLATELLKPTRTGPSRKKGTATKYWEMLQREEREREQLQNEQLAAAQELQGTDGNGVLTTRF
ncbi:hypothetical protein [Granulicella sp. L46]|uniref:hypothetical protein n=1 Tax=Granulicella sp. L46 TaxID=1641865 RepID=UPI00131E6122|nr:hypothetical protein [Granulicella sp. L46]